MEQFLDINSIIQNAASYVILGLIGWQFNMVRRNRKDMNCMFRKVRRIYRFTYGDEWEDKWND